MPRVKLQFLLLVQLIEHKFRLKQRVVLENLGVLVSKERSLEAGYVTVLLALVCCLIAVVLIVFVESANTVSDREIAQTIADEASLVALSLIHISEPTRPY